MLMITKILTIKEVTYFKFLDVVFNMLINVKGLVNLQNIFKTLHDLND